MDERLGSRKIGPWDRVNGDPSLNQVELSWYIGLAMVQPMGHRTCTTLYLCLVGWPSSKASNRAWGPVQLAGENVGPLESTRWRNFAQTHPKENNWTLSEVATLHLWQALFNHHWLNPLLHFLFPFMIGTFTNWFALILGRYIYSPLFGANQSYTLKFPIIVNSDPCESLPLMGSLELHRSSPIDHLNHSKWMLSPLVIYPQNLLETWSVLCNIVCLINKVTNIILCIIDYMH